MKISIVSSVSTSKTDSSLSADFLDFIAELIVKRRLSEVLGNCDQSNYNESQSSIQKGSYVS